MRLRVVLSTIALLALGLWLGSLVFFIIVAGVSFSVLPPLFPDTASGIHAAGSIVASALGDLHYFGLALGVIFIALSIPLRRTLRLQHLLPQIVLVGAMLVLTCYSQFSIIPNMETARASVGGNIAATPENNPAHQIFDRLHHLSTEVETAILICGLIAFGFAGYAHSLADNPTLPGRRL